MPFNIYFHLINVRVCQDPMLQQKALFCLIILWKLTGTLRVTYVIAWMTSWHYLDVIITVLFLSRHKQRIINREQLPAGAVLGEEILLIFPQFSQSNLVLPNKFHKWDYEMSVCLKNSQTDFKIIRNHFKISIKSLIYCNLKEIT